MTDFPEPKSFNGDEDEHQFGRRGNRLDDFGVCYECGREIASPVLVAWLGPFCSPMCATKGSERHAAAMDPRRI